MSTFDRSGALLEGIRISSGNNGTNFPPRNLVKNSSTFNAVDERSEYLIIADSLDPDKFDLEIADTDLVFRWVKNYSDITRFDYAQFDNRFLPLPGAPPEEIGTIENDPRLQVTVPNTDKLTEAPVDIYIFGGTSRTVTFTIQYVGADTDFTDPATLTAGIVELSRETGNLNFSDSDIQTYEDGTVLHQGQNFFDRRASDGIIGQLPLSSAEDYFIFMNPKPGAGQSPRIRIGYNFYLTPVEVLNEASLGSPATGTFTWSLDTGRIKFSEFDINNNSQQDVYYDGVTQYTFGLNRIPVTISGSGGKDDPVFTISGIAGTLDKDSQVDIDRFVIFAEEVDSDSVTDENQTLVGQIKRSLGSSGVVKSTIVVYNQDRTVQYNGPDTLTPDYFIIGGSADEAPQIYRSSDSEIQDQSVVSIDYDTVEVTRYYWLNILIEGKPSSVTTGRAYIDVNTGDVYISGRDLSTNAGKSYYYVDGVVLTEDGVAVQFFRSGANGSGAAVSSDFWIKYRVEQQLLNDNLGPFPFVTLPTAPIVDAGLIYTVEGSGGFTGELVRGGDPNTEGLGYFLDLSLKQLSFSDRRTSTITLSKDASFIKFDNAVISEEGLEIAIDGQSTTPGTDYDFDSTTGVIQFTTPVGENDPDNKLGIFGTITLPDTFTAADTFDATDLGRYLYISSGDNVGLYRIEFVSAASVRVTPEFEAAGTASADVRNDPEILVDRIWVALETPYKKFSISRAPSADGTFVELDKSEFSVQENVATIAIKKAADPDEVFSITYVALITEDEGATYTEENRTERALFKVRQETATSTAGSNTVTINPSGKTVSTARQIDVYVNGIILDEDENEFSFTPPGTITLDRKVEEGQTVIVNYWIEEASGGETTFTLQADQIELDRPEINEGEQTATFNGDQTEFISNGSVFFIEQTEVLIAQSVSYNSTEDETVVTFETEPTISTTSSDILVAEPVTFIEEDNNVDIIPEGTNALSIQGNVVKDYTIGSIIKVNDGPYHIIGAAYDPDFNKTTVTISGSFSQNYVIPILYRSERPIISPTLGFSTSKSAHLDFPVTLVKMGGSREVLVRDVDYTISEGGIVRLTENLAFGEMLYIMYVAREDQPKGTEIELNYAFAIAPARWNRLLAQKLLSSYNLYAPDTYFYRVETIDSFLPETNDFVRASASTGASGPNTRDAASSSTASSGTASPWYNEQHLANLDTVIIRLLKYYNDLVDIYEDILSNLDGRIVGGTSGRFRFDGNTNNDSREDYDDITNDIDDKYVFYYQWVLDGFWTFTTVPIFVIMAVPSTISRLFPTAFNAAVAINGRTSIDNFGDVLGNYGIEDLKSVKTSRNVKANHFFALSGDVGTAIDIDIIDPPQNGDTANLLPEFEQSDEVEIWTRDGVYLEDRTIDAIDETTFTLSSSPPISEGSILQKSGINTYEPGSDFSVDLEAGQLINNNRDTGDPPPDDQTSSLAGEEIILSPISINDPGLEPKRIPVLDGSTLNDDGRTPEPRLKRRAEFESLNDETTVSSAYLGFGIVDADLVTIEGSYIGQKFNAGDIIRWLDGPNAGKQRRVVSVPNNDSLVVNTQLTLDSTGSTFQVGSNLVATFGNQLVGENIGNNFIANDEVEFINGPNVHIKLQVTTIVDDDNIIVTPTGGTLVDDSSFRELRFQSSFIVANNLTAAIRTATSIVLDELGLLFSNVANSSVVGSLTQIAMIDAELTNTDSVITSYGKVIASGTGTVTATELTDAGADFTTDGADNTSLVYIASGSNRGLYQAQSVTATTITINTTNPWAQFPSPGSVTYSVIQPENFLDPVQFGTMSQFLRETLDFYNKTASWYSSISVGGLTSRAADTAARIAQVTNSVAEFEGVLTGGLYDTRFLWIQQRTHRQNGTLAQKLTVEEQTEEDLQQIKQDQRKIALMNLLG